MTAAKKMIEDFCAELFETSPINYFTYTICNFEDNKYIMISNRPDFVLARKKTKFPLLPLLLDEGYYWLNNIMTQDVLDVHVAYGIDNIFTILKRHEDYSETYSFGTPPNVEGMINFYLNNIANLEKFSREFKIISQSIITQEGGITREVPKNFLPAGRFSKEAYTVENIIKVLTEQERQKLTATTDDKETQSTIGKLQNSVLANISNFRSLMKMVPAKKQSVACMDEPLLEDISFAKILDLQNTPLDWLITLFRTSLGKNLLDTPHSKVLSKIFNINKKYILKKHQLGAHAKKTILLSEEAFEIKSKLFPITLDGIIILYEQFAEVEKDLTSDPRWDEFWSVIRKKVESNIEHYDITEQNFNIIDFEEMTSSEPIGDLIYELKQKFLFSYCNKVILYCHLNESSGQKSKSTYQDKAFRYMLKEINRLRGLNSPSQCHKLLKEHFETDLQRDVTHKTNELISYIQDIDMAKNTESVFIKNINKVKNSTSYLCLGDLGDKHLQPLVDLRVKYDEIVRLIDSELDKIVGGYVPTSKHAVAQTVDNLINAAADKILLSAAFKKMPLLSPYILRDKLLSFDALDKIHQNAVNIRLKYFGKFIPGQIEELTSKEKGINWLIYYKSRLDVINGLFNAYVLPNKNNSKNLEKGDQNRLLCTLQNLYFAAIQKGFKDGIEKEVLLNEMNTASILKMNHTEHGIGLTSRLINLSKNKIIEEMNTMQVVVPEKNKKKHLLFYSSPEVDLTLGLVDKMGKLLNNDNLLPDEAEYKKLVDSADNRSNSWNYMLYVPMLHEELKSNINQIEDYEARLHKVKDLFEGAKVTENFSDARFIKKSMEESDEIVYTKSQTDVIEFLQDIFIEALEHYWIHLTQKYAINPNQKESPKTITMDGATEIYDQCLGPAVDEDIVNIEITADRPLELIEKIHDMQNQLIECTED